MIADHLAATYGIDVDRVTLIESVHRIDRGDGPPWIARTFPAARPVEAAEGADMLVIGRGRHHALRKRVLGSVGTEVLQHAPCPVVVVTHQADEAAENAENAENAEA